MAAASEPGGVVTNGMSLYSQNNANSNSALLIPVKPEDFGSSHPLAGIEWKHVDRYAEQIKSGEKFDMPVLDYDEDNWVEHEGRHRVLAMKKLGVNKIDVMVVKHIKPDLDKWYAIAMKSVKNESRKRYKRFFEKDFSLLKTSLTKGKPNECYENARKELFAQLEKGVNAKYWIGTVWGYQIEADSEKRVAPLPHAWVVIDNKYIVDSTPFKYGEGIYSTLPERTAIDNFLSVRYSGEKVITLDKLQNKLEYFPQ
jgi:hypothetical protein